jgi:hypothetical protein
MRHGFDLRYPPKTEKAPKRRLSLVPRREMSARAAVHNVDDVVAQNADILQLAVVHASKVADGAPTGNCSLDKVNNKHGLGLLSLF